MERKHMDRNEILSWLLESGEERLEELWRRADETRRANVGDEVHLRGLIEISNYCVRQCGYCGLRADNAAITRYRMSEQEILDCGVTVEIATKAPLPKTRVDRDQIKQVFFNLIKNASQAMPGVDTRETGPELPVETT
jgi:signal transduction histidine kinase